MAGVDKELAKKEERTFAWKAREIQWKKRVVIEKQQVSGLTVELKVATVDLT